MPARLSCCVRSSPCALRPTSQSFMLPVPHPQAGSVPLQITIVETDATATVVSTILTAMSEINKSSAVISGLLAR